MKIETIKNYKPIHQLFECFHNFPNVAFLDSSLKGSDGRFSIIGLYPYLSLSTKDGKTTINGKLSTSSFEEFLKDYLKKKREENNTSLPIISGAIGYFSYSYALKKNGIESQHKRRLDVQDAFLNFYDVFIIEDHEERLLYIIANGKLKTEDESIKEIKHYLNIASKSADEQLKTNVEKIKQTLEKADYENSEYMDEINVKSDFEKDEYIKAIKLMKNHIIEGNIYVVNMTEQFMLKSSNKPYEVFKVLRNLSPSSFGSYIHYEDFTILSSSPERFLKVKDNKILTCPIKGTRKRGKTKKEDERLKSELGCSEKERAELLMIVDLERNDLNKICVPGSVKVENLFTVQTLAQVFHLFAKVEGQLRVGTDIVDILSAMFPGGSITGTPKLSAMKIIDNVEKSSRNIYTGSIGYIALDGSADLNIVIRTAIYQNDTYYVGAGGVITYESDEQFEMEEVLQKAKAIFHSIKFEQETTKDK